MADKERSGELCFGKADGARSGNDWLGTVWTGEVCEVWQIRRGVVSYCASWCVGLRCGRYGIERQVLLSHVAFRYGR